ncbi:MAG: GlxA family transcriptional regulator, partial [Burkholderiaceae bacterium]|nr:GlxA family transcriptional regulator [Burkholderiaceae bacterium]
MHASTPVCIAIALLPPCSMFGIGSVAEPFALANRLAGRPLYELKFYSWDGGPLALPNGLGFPVHGALR